MRSLFPVVTLFVSLSTYGGGVWTPAAVPTAVTEYGTGIKVAGIDASSNPANCVNSDGGVGAKPDLSDTQKNRMNSMILAAYMGGRRMTLKLSDTTCNQGYPTYYAVNIRD